MGDSTARTPGMLLSSYILQGSMTVSVVINRALLLIFVFQLMGCWCLLASDFLFFTKRMMVTRLGPF